MTAGFHQRQYTAIILTLYSRCGAMPMARRGFDPISAYQNTLTLFVFSIIMIQYCMNKPNPDKPERIAAKAPRH